MIEISGSNVLDVLRLALLGFPASVTRRKGILRRTFTEFTSVGQQPPDDAG